MRLFEIIYIICNAITYSTAIKSNKNTKDF